MLMRLQRVQLLLRGHSERSAPSSCSAASLSHQRRAPLTPSRLHTTTSLSKLIWVEPSRAVPSCELRLSRVVL
ncbi:hypothetical protein CgunFtcFv8_012448 [Champsocephalus gunnari]|uniref:Uncharacterized protein n=1 Tax=Champsocephalus gunnari TaxID=52237 RepID=A0AAN8DRI5_CHAGU|nr:hypothetical protein CgunFtcFv8_012448 [Champsocephalus gunnari]